MAVKRWEVPCYLLFFNVIVWEHHLFKNKNMPWKGPEILNLQFLFKG